MYGYFYDDSYVYLVYEYISKGNLFHLIKNSSRISEKEASKVKYLQDLSSISFKYPKLYFTSKKEILFIEI